MTSVRVLTGPAETRVALEEVAGWAEHIDIAYAWAASGGGKEPHWNALPLERVRRAVVGVHFAQTEPYVLHELHKLGVLRVVGDTGGVFHPKVLVAEKGGEVRALIGSSNFTSGGFNGNTEVNVLLRGTTDDEAIRTLTTFIDEQWAHPRAFEPDDEWFEEYQALYENRPQPPKPKGKPKRISRTVTSANDLDLAWSDFVRLIGKQEKRALWTGWTIRVFDHGDGSYLQEVEACQAAFDAEPRYARMPVEDRKLIAGWSERSTGYYGRMQGAGYFKNLSTEHPEMIAAHLDKIPLRGMASLGQARAFLEGITHVQGVALGTATRLLCMKRPDLFLPANNASLVNLARVFGSKPSTIDKYLEIIGAVWRLPWWSAPEPHDKLEQRIWAARVALLDAIFYEPPEYLK